MSNLGSNLAASLGLGVPVKITDNVRPEKPAVSKAGRSQEAARSRQQIESHQRDVSSRPDARTKDERVDIENRSNDVGNNSRNFQEMLEKRIAAKKDGKTEQKAPSDRKKGTDGQIEQVLSGLAGVSMEVSPEVSVDKSKVKSGVSMPVLQKSAGLQTAKTSVENGKAAVVSNNTRPVQADQGVVSGKDTPKADGETQNAEGLVAVKSAEAQIDPKLQQKIKEVPATTGKDVAVEVKANANMRPGEVQTDKAAAETEVVAPVKSNNPVAEPFASRQVTAGSDKITAEVDPEVRIETMGKANEGAKETIPIPHKQGENINKDVVADDRGKALSDVRQALRQGQIDSDENQAAAVLKEVVSETVVKTDGAFAVSSAGAQSTQSVNSASTVASVSSVETRGGVSDAQGVKSPGEQIIESIRMNTGAVGRDVDINLNPSELGSVRMRFREINGEITGLIEVDKAETRYEIEKEIPEIVASLQGEGVHVKRVEVVMNQQSNNGQSQNQQGDDLGTPQGSRFGTESERRNNPGTNESEHDSSQPVNTPESQQQTELSDQAINVYV